MLIGLLLLSLTAKSQTDSVYYQEKDFSGRMEELRAKYGLHKNMPAAYETGILAALSHYPELTDDSIEFVELPIHCTMMAQPRTRGMFKSSKRVYVIYINNCKANTGFLPSALSFNQFVGVMGHELAHVSYYTRRTAFNLFMDGMGYYIKDFRRSYEAGTDMITIDHGLGWQLIDFAHFIVTCDTLSPAYEKKKRTTYLGSQDLVQEMRRRQTLKK